jgi:hypothetical protein
MIRLLVLLAAGPGAAAQEAKKDPLVIRVARDGWGDAGAEDITKVLESAGGALPARFPGRSLPPIEVSRSNAGPITLFQPGPAGEFRVRLDVEGRHWSQFAFQFGHEMGHILCGIVEYENPNLWFEETLCEVASLYVLGRMAESWKAAPPYPNWKDYADSLAKYRHDRMEKARLPEGSTLAEWFRPREPSLRRDPRQRGLNLVMASAILPLFEESPDRWESVGNLNSVRGDAERPLRQYLQDWSRSAAEKHRGFIRKIGERYGVSIDP